MARGLLEQGKLLDLELDERLLADELAHARRIRRRLIVVLVQLMVANERRLLLCLLRLLPQLFDEVCEGERHLAVHAESVALVERALERVAVVRL